MRSVTSVLLDTPFGWALVAFTLYFFHAQFARMIGWNAVELIIAQHLLDHHVYAISVDYPSAFTWRPVAPTLLVTFFRLWTDDPRLIFRLVSGLSIAVLTGS